MDPAFPKTIEQISLPLATESLFLSDFQVLFPELCLSVACRGMGQQWAAAGAGALGAADLGMA